MPLTFKLSGSTHLILYPGLATPYDSVVGLVETGGEALVIDAGLGTEASVQALVTSLTLLGYPRRFRVGMVVNTHGHVQNAGGDWWFHDRLGAVIAARMPDASWIERGDPVKTGARDLGVPFHDTTVGLVVREDPLRIEVGGIRVEAHHTPGHTPGSQTIVVYDDKTIAFVGDSLGRLSKKWDSNEEDWYRSLDKIKSLDPDIVCTSAVCHVDKAARMFIEAVERAGPEWEDG